MIKFEYDPQSAGCKVSLLLLDSDFGHVPPLSLFDIVPEESQPPNHAMLAKQTPHNLRILANMLTILADNR